MHLIVIILYSIYWQIPYKYYSNSTCWCT
jgi:hypothetical protein